MKTYEFTIYVTESERGAMQGMVITHPSQVILTESYTSSLERLTNRVQEIRQELIKTHKGQTMLTIHKSAHYAAYLLNSSGLVIESTRKAGGVQLRPEHPQFAEYVDAIRTAIDTAEGDALCRALLN